MSVASHSAPSSGAVRPEQGPRPRWFADAIIAGFVATGALTVAFIIAYVGAAGFGSASAGGTFAGALYALTNNPAVSFGQARPAVSLLLHIVMGLVWAVLYARFVAHRLPGSAWQSGALWGLFVGVLSLVFFLPLVGAGLLGLSTGAGVLPIVGNLALNAIYGAVLGQLYAREASDAARADDPVLSEQAQGAAIRHSEDFSAAGILLGFGIGALGGAVLAVAIPRNTLDDATGWSLALAAGGLLCGGAIGGIIGSFAGLPQAAEDPREAALGPDHFELNWLPYFIIPTVLLVIVAVVVGLGSVLLTAVESGGKMLPVWLALGATIVVGVGGALVAWRQGGAAPSAPPGASHGGH
ncbi:MAG: hypothetical protein HYX52_00990 [Chloroflexi bacterium]|nr:hypothetical protein [Chloroflexota bacterium]